MCEKNGSVEEGPQFVGAVSEVQFTIGMGSHGQPMLRMAGQSVDSDGTRQLTALEQVLALANAMSMVLHAKVREEGAGERKILMARLPNVLH